jgi:hypothetical protein
VDDNRFPCSSRVITGMLAEAEETLAIATPVSTPLVLSKARRYELAARVSIGTTAGFDAAHSTVLEL